MEASTEAKPPAERSATLKNRIFGIGCKGFWYGAHHTFKAVYYPLATLLVGLVVGRFGLLPARDVTDQNPQQEITGQDHPKEHAVSKPALGGDPEVIADTSKSRTGLGAWLPPMDRLNEGRLNGSWRSVGAHEYRWDQNAHQLEIHVPGGGKWQTKYDGGWFYLPPEK